VSTSTTTGRKPRKRSAMCTGITVSIMREGYRTRIRAGAGSLQPGRPERVARTHVAAAEAGAEPAHPFGGRAVGERVGHHRAAGFALQRVVTDGMGGVERGFDVAGLQPVKAFLGLCGPDAGKAVGLQFLTYGQAFGAFQRGSLPARLAALG